MSYFEPPAEPRADDRPFPEWFWPPRDELGVELPLDRLVAAADTARLTLRSVVVYSNGFEFRILAEWAEGAIVAGHRIVQPQSEHYVRIAVEFADGRRATNVDAREDEDDDESPPEQPRLSPGHPQVLRDTGYSELGDLWVWGLPPAGDLVLVCEWPALGIPVSRLIVDGDEIRAAAARSEKLWA